MAAAVAQGVTVDHIARRSYDIRHLADFYIEIFGFEEVEAPQIGPLKVMWLNLPSAFTMHLIELPDQRIPMSPVSDTADIPTYHHICFSVSNFETFVQTLKGKGIQTAHRPPEFSLDPDGKIDQIFFFDPDGNGLEVSDATAARFGGAGNHNAD